MQLPVKGWMVVGLYYLEEGNMLRSKATAAFLVGCVTLFWWMVFMGTVTPGRSAAADLSLVVRGARVEEQISGLSITTTSPLVAGFPITFTAVGTAGTPSNYYWAFGDGSFGEGNPISHVYSTPNSYSVLLTATNAISVVTSTTELLVRESFEIYLPVLLSDFTYAPDLVVEEILATQSVITVVLRNQGPAATDKTFWVDVYVEPERPPEGVNETWDKLTDQGLVWAVTETLAPGDLLTLTVGGLYYQVDYSRVDWPLAEGTPIYAQVDSANEETAYGAILETHEIIGLTYNNVAGPVQVSGE